MTVLTLFVYGLDFLYFFILFLYQLIVYYL